jgi:Flp pilus assembly protein TadB
MSEQEKNKDLLMLEYQECQSGYNNRDNLVPQEFANFVQSFFAFLTLLFAIHIFAEVNTLLSIMIHLGLGIAGLLVLLAFLLDMQANTSCKRALKDRSREIENTLSDYECPKIWTVIQNRRKYLEERLFKGRDREVHEKTIGGVFVNTSRALVILWIAFVVMMIVLGDSIKFR